MKQLSFDAAWAIVDPVVERRKSETIWFSPHCLVPA